MRNLILICILILNYSFSSAQWNQTNGPSGGIFNVLERVGNSIWAGSRNGIYTSQNEGASWTKLPGITDDCLDIKSNGDTIVILCYSIPSFQITTYDLYTKRSIDGGLTFSLPSVIESGTSSYVYTNKIHRLNNILLFKGIWDWHISNNIGDNWSVYTLPVGDDMDVLTGNDSIIFMKINDFTLTKYLLYSSTDMLNFNFIDTLYNSIGGALMLDNSLFLSSIIQDTIIHQNITKSDDFGISWDTVFTSGPVFAGSGGSAHFNGGIYFAIYPNYIFSNDKGLTWNNITFPSGYGPSPYENNLMLSNGDVLNLAYPAGIVRYVPAQNIYYPTLTGIMGQNPFGLSSNKGNLYCGTISDSYLSSDAGATWQKIPIGINSIIDFAFCGDTIIGLENNYHGHFIRSFNNGATWDTISTSIGSTLLSPRNILFIGSTLYKSVDRVYKSDDLGMTWDTIPTWPIGSFGNCNLASNFVTGNLENIAGDLWSVTLDGHIYKYNATTQSWIHLFCFWSTGSNTNNRLYQLGSSVIVSGKPGMFISNNSGLTWSSYSPSTLPVTSAINFIDVNNIWATSCGEYGIYISGDFGATWAPLQTPPPFNASGGLTSLNGKLYSGSYYNSVWGRSGTLETISGVVFNDLNANNIQDINEKGIKGILLKLTTSGLFATTDSTGHYVLTYDVIGDTLKTVLPFFCSTTPSFYLSPGNSIQNYNFAVTYPITVSDLSVDLSNISVFRPGFQTNLKLTVRNQGSIFQPSIVNLQLDTILQFNSSIPSPTSIVGNSLTWDIDSLQFNSTSSIMINVTTSTTANLGDSVNCIASVAPSVIDNFPANNVYTLSDTIRGSYDPNDKQCLQGKYITTQQLQNGKELEFVVRFQNKGNFPASFIHIVDTLSPFLDVSTFKVVNASHHVEWSINGHGRIEFVFNNINLPASSFDEPNSHGLVKYTIKCKQGISLGDAIDNTAYIFFDFNPPIITNTTTTLAIENNIIIANNTSGNNNFELLLYPNPASNLLNIVLAEEPLNYYFLRIYTNLNQIYYATTKVKHNQIDISNFADGFYYGTLVNDKGELLKGFRFIIRH